MRNLSLEWLVHSERACPLWNGISSLNPVTWIDSKIRISILDGKLGVSVRQRDEAAIEGSGKILSCGVFFCLCVRRRPVDVA